MRRFDEIFAIAADRKGGPAALEAMLRSPLSVDALAARPASDWLQEMARAVFQAGFSWKVIEAKWPGFQTAFDGFDVDRVAFYHDADMDRLLADPGIVRNGRKIQSVIDNARMLRELEAETGNVSEYLARWPVEDQAALVEMLGRRGAHLGGNTAQRVLRVMGWDAYVLSGDVVKRLIAEGVVDKPPSSKTALRAVQEAFNRWQAESGRPMTQISQVLAMSVD
ncbi:DNA-3-methyladenine glycosylase I [Thalassovita sp.]|uniref:DNA-3-methyladenine glycosylase I n=1 Tax=Thalassovita sp. TaxID=1979401 RepID=UPI0029DE5230|nr:DNA-3-methyladenine glycosylase I [Thalassovita sp.]